MKNKILSLIIIAVCICTSAQAILAKKETIRKPLDARQENYIDIQEELRLNNKELEKFNQINIMEYQMVRPIALQLEANLLRLDELNEVKCRWYKKQCKKELEQNKAFISGDIKELKRQIRQKKEYYKILYINETTRRQDLKLREIIKNETKGKVQMW